MQVQAGSLTLYYGVGSTSSASTGSSTVGPAGALYLPEVLLAVGITLILLAVAVWPRPPAKKALMVR
jgi:hypothetical protein